MNRLLALTINGTPIPIPNSIKHITPSQAGFLGQNLIQNTITLLLIFATILSLIYLIIGAIQWISSGGEKDALQAAKQKITYALIGLVVSFLSFVILSLVSNLFGVSFFTGKTSSTPPNCRARGDC